MAYPFFSCASCGSNVQLEQTLKRKYHFPDATRYGANPDFFVKTTTELDSEDFANNCRGQGLKYAQRRVTAVQIKAGETITTDRSTQYNFHGQFVGRCCFCALRTGLDLLSFSDIGCYHCKRREILFFEFSRLKRARKLQLDDGGVVGSSWKANGWSGLSDALIDHILVLAVNVIWDEGGGGNMDCA
jgi:hypothetical protein